MVSLSRCVSNTFEHELPRRSSRWTPFTKIRSIIRRWLVLIAILTSQSFSAREKRFPKFGILSFIHFPYTHLAKPKNGPVSNFYKSAQARIQQLSWALPRLASSDTSVSSPGPAFFRIGEGYNRLSLSLPNSALPAAWQWYKLKVSLGLIIETINAILWYVLSLSQGLKRERSRGSV